MRRLRGSAGPSAPRPALFRRLKVLLLGGAGRRHTRPTRGTGAASASGPGRQPLARGDSRRAAPRVLVDRSSGRHCSRRRRGWRRRALRRGQPQPASRPAASCAPTLARSRRARPAPFALPHAARLVRARAFCAAALSLASPDREASSPNQTAPCLTLSSRPIPLPKAASWMAKKRTRDMSPALKVRAGGAPCAAIPASRGRAVPGPAGSPGSRASTGSGSRSRPGWSRWCDRGRGRAPGGSPRPR